MDGSGEQSATGPEIEPKPTALRLSPDNIPHELKALRHWVTWRYEYRDDKWTKPLFRTDGGGYAKSNDSETWGDYPAALATYQKGGFEGIGFVLTPELGITGVDLDHCYNPAAKSFEPWAIAIIEHFKSYTEASPSGTGVRIFLKGKLPAGGRKNGNIEIYSGGRYLTVTGRVLRNGVRTLEPRQTEIDAFLAEYFPVEPKVRKSMVTNGNGHLSDCEIIDLARRAKNGEKFGALLAGNCDGYPSTSEADLGLCSLLAFYTQDESQIDRIYRGSRLFRDKWDEKHYGDGESYGQHTIQKAIASTLEIYQGSATQDGKTENKSSAEAKSTQNQATTEPTKEHHFTLVTARDVLAAEDVEQSSIWDGILPAGGMSLLVAKPKVGKTTLAFNLAVAVSRGADFLNRKTEQGPVVYLALEEKRGEMKKKLAASGIADESLKFHFGSAPVDAMAQVEPLIVQTKAKLLIIDVLQKFCRLRDLNDYAIVTNALEPLMAAARKHGCHILLTHHAGKADRPDGDDILGSTGLLGGVDTSIHIKKRDKRRTFFTIQRYGDDIEETVIELGEDGSLEAKGSRQEVEIEEVKPLILAVLKTETLSKTEIYDHIEKGKTIVSKAVDLLVESGELTRTGSGKRNDAYKYSALLPSDTNEGNRAETKTASNPVESKGLFCPDDFDVLSPEPESARAAFSSEKPALNGADKGINATDALDLLGGKIVSKE